MPRGNRLKIIGIRMLNRTLNPEATMKFIKEKLIEEKP
jgi:hypothetical protein